MRIIGGHLGGRKIHPPVKMPYTRPTTDVAKEGLFNIIENNLDISSLKALDLFGGTGSISYELASRGGADITVVEKDGVLYDFIKRTAKELELGQITAVKMDVFKYIAQCADKFNFIFAGPPYALTTIEELPAAVFHRSLLLPKGWFVLEHTPRNDFKKLPFFAHERKYGTTVFSIFING